MSFKSKLSWLLLTLSLANFTSCSKIQEMGDNAKVASDNSGKAATAAGESREEIAAGRLMTRSGSTSQSRRESFLSMLEMDTLAMKITEASKYVKGFEFQLWTGQKYDTKDYLDVLYEDALQEFFRSLYEANGDKSLAKSDFSPFKLIGKGSKERTANIYALALAMHGEHNVQKYVIVPNKEELDDTTSIYTLIRDTLVKIRLVEQGKRSFAELKPFELAVYDYREDAIALMQARYNALLTLAVARLSPLKDGKVEALNTLYLKRSFNSRFLQLNLGQQYQTNVYLDAAVKVKRLLKEVGVEAEIIKPLDKLYKKMILPTGHDDQIATSQSISKEEFNNHLMHLSKLYQIKDHRLQDKLN
jgi:hypothetical protein